MLILMIIAMTAMVVVDGSGEYVPSKDSKPVRVNEGIGRR